MKPSSLHDDSGVASEAVADGKEEGSVQVAAYEVEVEHRRSALRKLSSAALVAVTSVGMVLSRPAPASALYYYGCCGLYFPHSRDCSLRCPTSASIRSWYCNYGGRTYGCHECTGGSSCWQGPFYCSYYTVN